MPSLKEAYQRHCETYLDILAELSQTFEDGETDPVESVDKLDSFWPQIESAQRWAAETFRDSMAAALLTQRFTVFCADNGDQLIEIHRSAALRAEWLQNGVAAAEVCRDEMNAASIGYNLGLVLVGIGDLVQAKKYVTKARETFHKFGSTADECAACNSLGLIAATEGDDNRAVDEYETARELASKADLRREGAVATHFIGKAYLRLGRKQEGITHLMEALKVFNDLGNDSSCVDIIVSCSRAELKAGNSDLARRLCDNALTMIEDRNLPIDGNLLHHRVGALLLDLGHERTETLVELWLTQARQSKNYQLEGCLLQIVSLSAYKTGDTEKARLACEESLLAFQTIDFSEGVAAAQRLQETINEC